MKTDIDFHLLGNASSAFRIFHEHHRAHRRYSSDTKTVHDSVGICDIPAPIISVDYHHPRTLVVLTDAISKQMRGHLICLVSGFCCTRGRLTSDPRLAYSVNQYVAWLSGNDNIVAANGCCPQNARVMSSAKISSNVPSVLGERTRPRGRRLAA